MSDQTQYLDLPGGRLAYDDEGDGPLIVCLPSMLDLRSQFRFLRPRLLEAGYRVVTVDQRGMGDSSAAWPEYGSTPLAHDLMALLRHLDAGPALVYGCSNGAAPSAVQRSAQRLALSVQAGPVSVELRLERNDHLFAPGFTEQLWERGALRSPGGPEMAMATWSK